MMRRWACKHRKWYSYGWDLKDWNFGIQIDFMCRHFTFSFGPWWIMLWWNKEDWDIEDMGEEIEDKEVYSSPLEGSNGDKHTSKRGE